MTMAVLKSFRCFYCQQDFPSDRATADHFIPRSKKGRARSDNLVLACRACNEAKAAIDPRKYGVHRPAPGSDSQRQGIEMLRMLIAERRADAELRRQNRLLAQCDESSSR